jgi:hypothetical protein
MESLKGFRGIDLRMNPVLAAAVLFGALSTAAPLAAFADSASPDGGAGGNSSGSGDGTADGKNAQPVTENSPAVGHADDCGAYRQSNPSSFVIIYDVAANSFDAPGAVAYSNSTIRLCIDHPDYRMRYRVASTYTDLPPIGDKDMLNWVGNLVGKLGGAKAMGFRPVLSMDSINTAQEAVKRANADIDAQVDKLKAMIGALTGAAPVGRNGAAQIRSDAVACEKALEDLTKQVKQAVANLDPGGLNGEKPIIADAEKGASKAVNWTAVARVIVQHVDDVEKNIFAVRAVKDKQLDVAITGAPLASGGDDEQPELKYKSPTELARRSFEIHSLSYVRYGIGVVFTDLRDQSVQRGLNDVGAEVLQVSTSPGFVPMFFVTHYWCGADERRTQPWDRNRGGTCWRANTFAPTFTLGIPLSQNPFKNLYAGLTLQPVPAIAFTLGVHLGQVTRVRPTFVDGQALPPTSTGFRDQDVLQDIVRFGFYLGVMVTDAIFTKVLRTALGQ